MDNENGESTEKDDVTVSSESEIRETEIRLTKRSWKLVTETR